MSARAKGFTLIEALVALALLGILAAMAWNGLDGLMTTRQTLATQQAGWQGLNLLFGRIGQDMDQVCNRSIRDAQGNVEPPLVGRPDAGGADDWQLAFTRMGDAQTPLERLAYRLRNHAVELLVWPALDQAPGTRPTRYVLMDGVQTFDLSYRDDTGDWLPAWPPAGSVMPRPLALRVDVTLADGRRYERLFALP